MGHPAATETQRSERPKARSLAYLRVSVTDACGLRCVYCSPPARPAAGGPRLSAGDIERVVRAARRLGVTHVRLTGGEPLERPDIVDVVGRIARLGLRDVSLTTNGIRLAKLAAPLREAGLTRVNVSLPHVDARGFERITGQDAFSQVLEGIVAAKSAGLEPVKTNTVMVRGANDTVACELVELGRRMGLVVRFIEYMTSVDGAGRDGFVPARAVLAQLDERFGLERVPGGAPTRTGWAGWAPGGDGPHEAAGPARYYRLREGGLVGVIAPVSEPFCERCNRLRLTAGGELRPCLYGEEGVNLLPLLGGAGSAVAIEEALHRAMSMKPGAHGERLPNAMRSIGG
jgi:cyclic pyranopterin phosphate synthase